MAENRPPGDVLLLAPKASLVVRSDLHPAIQYLLLAAAEEIHSGPGIFKKAERFPAAEPIDLPLSDVAHQFYRSGEPFLQRHLPFWLAAVTVRLLVLLIPVIGVLYPLLRFLPALYGWKMRRRIYRLYGELRGIERGLENRDIAEQDRRELDVQLDRLEEVPTLRNVARRYGDFPKAYSHNGYFKSLKGIVDFYNTRDVKPQCEDPLTTEKDAMKPGCWPEPEVSQNVNSDELGNLGLTDAEEDAIVAFLETLSDGYKVKEKVK